MNDTSPEIPKGGRVLLQECDICWIARDIKDSASGHLMFHKQQHRYQAVVDEVAILFPKLAKGNFADPMDCPVREDHTPRAAFVMLLALRESFPTHSPRREWQPDLWRRLAVRLQLRETAEERGVPTPEETMARALAVAESWQDFERHAGITLAIHASEVGAGKLFRRFAGWMDAIDKLIEEGVPQQYDRLLRAVEAAAEECRGIPSQKSVRQFFEDGMSANQLGEADPFRSVLRKLRFDWLPPGGRGPSVAPKKSGRRSPT